MVLSDRDIRAAIAAGRIGIDPFDPKCVQPASVDIRLDHRFRVFRSSRHAFIDLARPLDDITELVQVPPMTPFILHPNEFVLGSTRERIRLEGDIPSAADPPLGCVFHNRCPRRIGPICDDTPPPTREISSGHRIVCHIPAEELARLQSAAASSPAPTR